MKVLFLFAAFILCMVRVYSQSTLPLRADTVIIEKVGGNGFLRLKDSSRNTTGGILTNIGGGVYVGKRPRKNGDTLFIGRDTFVVVSTVPTWQQTLNVTNGKILTSNNTVNFSGHDLAFVGEHSGGQYSYWKFNDALGNFKAVSKETKSSTDSSFLRLDGSFELGQLGTVSNGVFSGLINPGGISKITTSYGSGTYGRYTQMQTDTTGLRMQNNRTISGAVIAGHDVYVYIDSIVLKNAVTGQNVNLYLIGLPVSSSSGDSVLVKGADGRTYVRAQSDIAGGASPTTISNVGTGYRLVKTSSGAIKTVENTNTVIWDSTATTLKANADTSYIATQSDLRDTAAAIRASTGGGSQTLQQTLAYGNTTSIPIISTSDIDGDSANFYNFHFRGNGTIGDTVLSALQPYSVWGSSISNGYGASYAYSAVQTRYLQITVTNNSVDGSRIVSGVPNNLYDKKSLFPVYTSNAYGIAWDAGVNDTPSDSATYKVQLGVIIDTCIISKNYPSGKVLVISPPYSPARLTDSVYVGINAGVVAIHGGVAIDIFHPMEYAYHHGQTDLLTSDSLHPSTKGQEYIANLISDATRNGYYYGKLTVYGDVLNKSNEATIGNDTTYGSVIPMRYITSPVNVVRLMNQSTSNGGKQYLRFIPNPVLGSNVTDSFDIIHEINQFNQSRWSLSKVEGTTRTRLIYVDSAKVVYIGSDANPAPSGSTASLGAAYINSGIVVNGFDIGGDANAVANRWNVYHNGNLRGSIGFSGVDGMRIGSSYAGVGIGSISSSDGTTYTNVVYVPQGSTSALINTTTNNGVGALQVNGKITVATHSIGSNSDSALILDRTTNEYKYAKINAGATPTWESVMTTGAGFSNPHTSAFAGNAWTITSTQSSTAAVNINNTGNGNALSATTTGTGSAATISNSSSGTGATISSSSGFGANITSTTGLPLRTKATPSSTNTIVTTFRTIRGSSATAAAGMGNAHDMQITDNAGNDVTGTRLATVWTNAATAGPSAEFQILNINAGSLTRWLTLGSTGQLNLPGYGAGGFTGTPTGTLQVTSGNNVIEGPIVAAGTYTPTITNETNITTSTAYQCQYMRVGNVVTVSGKIYIDYTSAGVPASVGISLPITSSISNDYEVAGTANADASYGKIQGDATNDRAQFFISVPSSAAYDYFFTFTYQIL